MPLIVLNPPGAEPITLSDAKAHLQVDHTEEDVLIADCIAAAREEAEGYTRRAFVAQGLALVLDAFPCAGGAIELPRPPLRSVEAVAYRDANGVERALVEGADYQVDTASAPGRIAPAPGRSWPATQPGRLAAVRVEYSAGPSAPERVPERARAAMKLMMDMLYRVRGMLIAGTIVSHLPAAENLLRPLRIYNAPPE